jgi:hypothetical protein
MPKLHILSGVLEGKSFDLIEERITMGRALDNVIRLEDGTISHHHATLVLDGADFKLRDLNSTNGTRVNGLRIVETKLHNGDQVRLGSVEMRYESDVRKASQPLPPSQSGVQSAQLGKGGGPPPTFGSVSPFRKRTNDDTGPLKWIILGLGVVAIVALVFVLYRLLA